MTNSNPLKSNRHEMFCQKYVVHHNGAKAWEEAGGAKKTARIQASKLLTKPNIQKRIQELMDERKERVKIEQDDVLRELKTLMMSDILDYVEIEEGGALRLKDLKSLPKGLTRAIKSITEDRIIRETADGKQIIVHDKIKFKLWDKTKVIEMICKHLNMYVNKTGDIPDAIFRIIYANGNSPRPGASKGN